MFNYNTLSALCKQFGDSYYLLDSNAFISNYHELLKAYRSIYPKTCIAYSYKTNYIPHLCELINSFGGYAEVVSNMEYTLAKKVGVPSNRIFFNGPYKNEAAASDLLLHGGIVNIDSLQELNYVCSIANMNPDSYLNVGIRCNFDIGDTTISRFGFDVDGIDFKKAISRLSAYSNIIVASLHCHFANRELKSFHRRSATMIGIINKHLNKPPKYISLGGGMFGKMKRSLAEQFNIAVPTYEDYANSSATVFRDSFQHMDSDEQPILIIEPGSAIVGDALRFITKVYSIKNVRKKHFATLAGSVYNINPTLNNKNLPVTVISSEPNTKTFYENIDLVGYTCIEGDVLYKNYTGFLARGDFVIFENIGSYSIVLKPPFILPNFPVLEYDAPVGEANIIKRAECFNDIFMTFNYDGFRRRTDGGI